MFNQEVELVDAFSMNTEKFLKEIFNGSISGHFLLKEFDSYVGIADLVVGTYKPNLSRKVCREPVNLNWVHPLTDLRLNQRISVDEFKYKYNLSTKSSIKRLNEYVQSGFLKIIEVHQYIVTKEYEVITENIVAIEAKLKNWKRALFQAKRYKKFSDFAFVLLDESYANSAISNLEKFGADNIGLVTMNNTSFTIHHLPNKQNPKKQPYFIRINEAAHKHFSVNAAMT